MPEYVDLTPTDDGYARIAGRYIAQILDDVPNKRKESDRKILEQLIDITFYLGTKADPHLVGQGEFLYKLRELIKTTGGIL